MAALSGTYLDLITDGLPDVQSRAEVVMAVRRVMLSAHRCGVPESQVFALLTDTEGRRLAAQIATGRGGRKMTTRQRSKFLRDLWEQTRQVAASRPAWSRDDALAAIEYVRDNWTGTEALPAKHRQVLDVVLDLATEYGTTRPVVPVREVTARTGIPRSTVSRILRELADDGEWLRLVKRGNHHTRRASLYTLAPDLLHAFTVNLWGASPPKSHGLPMSHPPMSHSGDTSPEEFTVESAADEIVNLQGSPKALAEFIIALAERDPALVRQATDLAEERSHRRLRVVGETA